MQWSLGKGRNLLSENGVSFGINQLKFADDTALVAYWEKLCRLESEFGRVCYSKVEKSECR